LWPKGVVMTFQKRGLHTVVIEIHTLSDPFQLKGEPNHEFNVGRGPDVARETARQEHIYVGKLPRSVNAVVKQRSSLKREAFNPGPMGRGRPK